MNILFLHSAYLINGGEDESTRNEVNLLKQNGHNVFTYIVDNKSVFQLNKLSLALSTIWSTKSYNTVKKLILENDIEIMHVQNFLPTLSPSVYYAAKSLGIPVIQAIRNYRLICPNAMLFRDNELCYKCVGKKFPYHGVFFKCYRNSYSASTVVVLMLFFHNCLNTWNKKVDKYLAVSEFVKQAVGLGRIDKERILVKSNFLMKEDVLIENHENYFVFVGRLSREKGIETLCNAWRILGKHVHLKVIGEGVEKDEIINLLNDGFQIEYLGKLTNNDTLKIISKAKAIIIPSIWNEPFGRVVIEAFSMGVPVIASRTGGMIELIEDNVTGFLFEASNHLDLANKVRLINNHDNLSKIKINAYQKYIKSFSAEANYNFLMGTYQDVIHDNQTN